MKKRFAPLTLLTVLIFMVLSCSKNDVTPPSVSLLQYKWSADSSVTVAYALGQSQRASLPYLPGSYDEFKSNGIAYSYIGTSANGFIKDSSAYTYSNNILTIRGTKYNVNTLTSNILVLGFDSSITIQNITEQFQSKIYFHR